METSLGDADTDHEVPTSFYCQSTIEFQNALKSSVENILNRVTDDVFIEIYKDCYKGFQKKDDVERPSLGGSSTEARKYRKQFNAMVTQSTSEIINETLTAAIDTKLKELEEVKQEQLDTSFKWRNRRYCSLERPYYMEVVELAGKDDELSCYFDKTLLFFRRPPGDAFRHMIPFDTVSKIEEKKQYENCIEKEKEVINLLKVRLAQKRLKAKELHNILQSSLKKIENAVVVPVSPEEKDGSDEAKKNQIIL